MIKQLLDLFAYVIVGIAMGMGIYEMLAYDYLPVRMWSVVIITLGSYGYFAIRFITIYNKVET